MRMAADEGEAAVAGGGAVGFKKRGANPSGNFLPHPITMDAEVCRGDGFSGGKGIVEVNAHGSDQRLRWEEVQNSGIV